MCMTGSKRAYLLRRYVVVVKVRVGGGGGYNYLSTRLGIDAKICYFVNHWKLREVRIFWGEANL